MAGIARSYLMIRRTFILLTVLSLATSAFAKPGGGGPGKGGQKKQPAEPPADTTPPASQPSQPSSNNPALQKAQADLQTARAAARTKYESSPAWTGAVAALKSSQADNDSAVKPVLEAAKNDAKYKATAADLSATEAKMSTLRQSDEPDPAAMSAAAKTAMSDRATLRALEKSAVSSDPTAGAAAQRLTDAQAAMTKLREDEESTISADPDVIVAKQAVDDAKTKS